MKSDGNFLLLIKYGLFFQISNFFVQQWVFSLPFYIYKISKALDQGFNNPNARVGLFFFKDNASAYILSFHNTMDQQFSFVFLSWHI